ncbi:hypothetical protein [Paludisphaera mucosa]|uniref:Uncharacterized protein n=1 Tax=Paludisphaera mucosa TaxID=3030827 RepID=A0ABT6FBB4_9BACT|nr:hypothetical protein [Paludisphaera mucosa]MDG3004678.1 hypothetical protein [Paludisphaera mucosa]
MSGPIVRKYGFPNHEQIFGRRPPEHGADEPKKDEDDAAPKPAEADPKAAGKPEPKADQRGEG